MSYKINSSLIKYEQQGFIHEQDLYDHIQRYDHNEGKNKINKYQNKIKNNHLIKIQQKHLNRQIKTNTIDRNKQIQKYQNRNKSLQKYINIFPAIKIVRLDEPMLNYFSLVYKGFRPKTSDKYFKYFQEINIQIPLIKQLHIKNLTFNSKFECGNLDYAFRVSETIYDLYMRVDTNTQGHRQWYYFSVKNKKCCKVTFNIFEFTKPLSLYQRGMRPYVSSKREINQKINKSEWNQAGYNVTYKSLDDNLKSKRYVLSFQYEFKYQNDEVYFAACPPYSYTFLNNRIQFFKTQCKYEFQIQNLTNSMCGLSVPIITISSKFSEKQPKKKYIIMISRTHPGETSSSWVMDGIMENFNRKTEENDKILHEYIFKLIPMMNSDGVYMGNYRTGILGIDFNRIFYSGKQIISPECTAIKILVKQIKKNGDQIQAFIDIHGHSIQRNSFIFGPSQDQLMNSKFSNICFQLSRRSRYFKEQSCKFINQEKKIETARVYFQFKQKIFSLTIENSLGLYYFNKITFPFLIQDFIKFGNHIVQALSQCLKNKQYIKPKAIFDSNLSNIVSKIKRNVSEKQTKQNLNCTTKQKKDFSSFYSTNLDQKTYKIKKQSKKLEKTMKIFVKNNIQIKNKQCFAKQQDNITQNYEESLNDSDSESQNLPKQIIDDIIMKIDVQEKISKISKKNLNINPDIEINKHLKQQLKPIIKIANKEPKLMKCIQQYKQIPFVINNQISKCSTRRQNKSLHYRQRIMMNPLKQLQKEQSNLKTQPIYISRYLNDTIIKIDHYQDNSSNKDSIEKKKFLEIHRLNHFIPILKKQRRKKLKII